jgi:hypothetical protein
MPPIDIRPRGSGVLNDLDSGAIAHRRPTTRLTTVLAAAGGDTHSSEYRAEVDPDPRMSDKAAEGHKHVSPIVMPDRRAKLEPQTLGTSLDGAVPTRYGGGENASAQGGGSARSYRRGPPKEGLPLMPLSQQDGADASPCQKDPRAPCGSELSSARAVPRGAFGFNMVPHP